MDLRVPLRRVTVELCLGGQATRQVELFLGEHSDRAWHRQEVLDLLEGGRQFLPCRDARPGSSPTLINRDHIIWLAIRLDDDRSVPDEEGAGLGQLHDRRHQVRLQLAGGVALEGAVLHSGPVEQARLMDHLNQDSCFLALYRNQEILLVRKSAVLEVLEETIVPAEDREPNRSR